MCERRCCRRDTRLTSRPVSICAQGLNCTAAAFQTRSNTVKEVQFAFRVLLCNATLVRKTRERKKKSAARNITLLFFLYTSYYRLREMKSILHHIKNANEHWKIRSFVDYIDDHRNRPSKSKRRWTALALFINPQQLKSCNTYKLATCNAHLLGQAEYTSTSYSWRKCFDRMP